MLHTPKRSALAEVTNVSPTANLRLLTNVALQCPYQRKEKSLQILCDRFLELYPLRAPLGGAEAEIQLDATAQRLGVEKRRIYDIINILEALQCAAHRRKNTYTWHGGSHLERFLALLKRQGESAGTAHPYGCAPKRFRQAPPKRRSLGNLAQRFLMMFLVHPPNTLINLEMAVATLIRPPDESDGLLKSKVRRLYDIANVLASVGLVERVPASTLKKPVFRYVGPDCATPVSSAMMTPDSLAQRGRAPSRSLPVRSKRKLDFSAPTPPSTPTRNGKNWDVLMQVVHMEMQPYETDAALLS